MYIRISTGRYIVQIQWSCMRSIDGRWWKDGNMVNVSIINAARRRRQGLSTVELVTLTSTLCPRVRRPPPLLYRTPLLRSLSLIFSFARLRQVRASPSCTPSPHCTPHLSPLPTPDRLDAHLHDVDDGLGARTRLLGLPTRRQQQQTSAAATRTNARARSPAG